MSQNSLGRLYIICAPSGAGKSSITRALLDSEPSMRLSVSYTTRAPRTGEIDGVHYNFTTLEDFENRVEKGEFLESAYVHGNYYGTNKLWIESELKKGTDIILEIDWQGADQVKEVFPDVTRIFILPPSYAVLEKRLRGRGTDTEEVIQKRLAGAALEIAQAPRFDYIVINDDFDTALNEVRDIVHATHLTYGVQKIKNATAFAEFKI